MNGKVGPQDGHAASVVSRLWQDADMMCIMHIPGRIMAADAPSRLEALNMELCEKTRKMLFEFWQSQVEDERNITLNLKRYR